MGLCFGRLPYKKGCIVCWEPVLTGKYCICVWCRAYMHLHCKKMINNIDFCPNCLELRCLRYERIVPMGDEQASPTLV